MLEAALIQTAWPTEQVRGERGLILHCAAQSNQPDAKAGHQHRHHGSAEKLQSSPTSFFQTVARECKDSKAAIIASSAM